MKKKSAWEMFRFMLNSKNLRQTHRPVLMVWGEINAFVLVKL